MAARQRPRATTRSRRRRARRRRGPHYEHQRQQRERAQPRAPVGDPRVHASSASARATRPGPTHPRRGRPAKNTVISTVNGTWTFFQEWRRSWALGAITRPRWTRSRRPVRRTRSRRGRAGHAELASRLRRFHERAAAEISLTSHTRARSTPAERAILSARWPWAPSSRSIPDSATGICVRAAANARAWSSRARGRSSCPAPALQVAADHAGRLR